MFGNSDELGQFIRLLVATALTGVGGLVAAVCSAFGASGPWLLVFPAAGLVAGLIVNRTVFGD